MRKYALLLILMLVIYYSAQIWDLEFAPSNINVEIESTKPLVYTTKGTIKHVIHKSTHIFKTASDIYMIINSSGYYEFNESIYISSSVGIYIVNASNVILNGNGFTFRNIDNDGIAIQIVNSQNITIYNMTLSNWRYGLVAENVTKLKVESLEIYCNDGSFGIKDSSDITINNTKTSSEPMASANFTNIENMLILNSTIRAQWRAVLILNAYNITIREVVFSSRVSLDVRDSQQVSILNNEFLGIHDAIALSNVSNVNISNNYAEDIYTFIFVSYLENDIYANIIIENNTINNNGYFMDLEGIEAKRFDLVYIRNNFINSTYRGFDLGINASRVFIENNTIYCKKAFYIDTRNYETQIRIENNIIYASVNEITIDLRNARGITILNNTIFGGGIYIENSYDLTIENVTVNDKPVMYFENKARITITGEIGQAIIVSSNNITMDRVYISNVYAGIIIENSSNIHVLKSRIGGVVYGIILYDSMQNEIKENMIFSRISGIRLLTSKNNKIVNNKMIHAGINPDSSSSPNEYRDNKLNGKYIIVLQNQRNIVINQPAGQIIIFDSKNIIIMDQDFLDVHTGIMIFRSGNIAILNSFFMNVTISISTSYSNVTIVRSNFIETEVYCVGSVDNVAMFFMNNFFDSSIESYFMQLKLNTEKAIDYRYRGSLHHYLIGNYWSDNNGIDSNGDGIIDTAYGKDEAPLAEPFDAYSVLDTDGDGLDDLVEYGLGTSISNSDTDNDGLNDIFELANGTLPTIADTDGDGMPDGWEVAYGLDPTDSADASLDSDNDNLTNVEEYMYDTNPVTADTDGDGMPDGWEVAYGLDPTDSADASLDSDNDNLTNVEEYMHGTNPTVADTDGDGYKDGEEVLANADPTDPESYPQGFGYIPQGSTGANMIFYISSALNIVLIAALVFVIFKYRRKE